MPTTNSTIQFKHGLQEAFSSITKDSNTIYFITDTNRLFVGDSEYTRPVQHGSELPTSKNPANSLFVKETGTSRELYYSKDGTAWDMIAYLPATITGGVFGDNTAGTVAYGGTVKVPKVTVDNRGYVTAAEDVTLTLPTSDKVTTVTTSGDGNAVTGGSISNDGTTLTLTKGQEFVPASGGTFTGDVTIDGDISSAHGISTESISYENLDLGNLSYNKVTLPGVTFEDSHSINAVTTEQLQNVPKQAIFDNTRLILKDDDNTGIYCLSSNGKKLDKFISIKNRPIFSGSDTYDSEITISSNTCNTSSVSIDSKYTYISGQLFMKNDVLRLATAPTSDMDAATKKYVDDSVSGIVSAVDAMKFKGTIGTSGTVADIASISSPSTGDTYKIITATSLTSEQSFDGAAHDLTVGDLVVYASNKWVFVPSGDEDVTSVKVAGSGDTINVSTTAQTGTVVLGDVATKNVSTSTTLNGNGASNNNVATELAVKTYVDDTVGALENTLGTAATTNATDYATAAQGTKADNAMPKSGGTFTGDVTVSGDLTADNIKTSGEITITPNTNVDITTHEQEHDNSKITFVNTNQVNNDTPISIESVYEAAVYGTHAYDTSILKLNAEILKLNADRTEINGNQGLHVNTINTLDIANEYSESQNPYRETDSVILKKTWSDHSSYDASIKFSMIDSGHGQISSDLELNANNINFNGTVTLAGAPTTDLNAATKKYVDDAVTAATLTWKTL